MSEKRDLINERYDVIKTLESDYDDAIIGVSTDDRLIYDYDLMIKCLIDNQGFTEIDAIEWISYNTIRCLDYMGSNAPIVMYSLEV